MEIILKNLLKRNHLPVLTLIVILIAGVLSASVAFAQTGTEVGVFENLEIKPGVLVEVPVDIHDVENLYGFDLELEFDPSYLQFSDADPQQEGVQVGLGTFLDPGFTMFNIVEPQEGKIKVLMTQFNPSTPKSGDGTLLVLYLTGLKTGQTMLEMSKVDLSTRYGEGIPANGVGTAVDIVTDAPVVTATSIPVIDPIEVTVIPTLEPSQIPPTLTPRPTATFLPTRTSSYGEGTQPVLNTSTPKATGSATQEPPANTATSAPTRTATLMPTQSQAAPTETQGQVTLPTSQPTRAGTDAPAATSISAEPASAVEQEGEETPVVDPTRVSPAEETLAALTEQPNPEVEEGASVKANNTDERLLEKDTAQSPGKLLPWLIGAAALLIIAVGIYFGSRKNRAISEEDK